LVFGEPPLIFYQAAGARTTTTGSSLPGTGRRGSSSPKWWVRFFGCLTATTTPIWSSKRSCTEHARSRPRTIRCRIRPPVAPPSASLGRATPRPLCRQPDFVADPVGSVAIPCCFGRRCSRLGAKAPRRTFVKSPTARRIARRGPAIHTVLDRPARSERQTFGRKRVPSDRDQ
jgi:hypothetical protein